MDKHILSREYLRKARNRRAALETLRSVGGHDDVVRESQELVELLLKGLLRAYRMDPPKVHDVSRMLRENAAEFPAAIQMQLDRICEISRRLRKERELSFYGDEDFLPSENYTASHSDEAIDDVDWLLALVGPHLDGSA